MLMRQKGNFSGSTPEMVHLYLFINNKAIEKRARSTYSDRGRAHTACTLLVLLRLRLKHKVRRVLLRGDKKLSSDKS